ncbi:MAG: hypothetical protein HQK87_06000 [Nitrospinae bacterium]|nr:hypothetical protein [Nitrospinota bacterium]
MSKDDHRPDDRPSLEKIIVPPYHPNSFAYWDAHVQLSVHETLALWSECVPTVDETEYPARWQNARFKIYEAIDLGKLTAYIDPPADPELRRALGKQYPGFVVKDFPQKGNPSIVFLMRDELRRFAESIGDRPLFLFPEGRNGRDVVSREDFESSKVDLESNDKSIDENGNAEEEQLQDFRFSPDYRSVNLNGTEYRLNATQAEAIKLLHEYYLAGTPDLSEATVLQRIGCAESYELRKGVFKHSKEAYKALIRKGGTPKSVRINL